MKDNLIDDIGTTEDQRPKHPMSGQHVLLNSLSSGLDRREAVIKTYFLDWDKHTGVIATDYMRRRLRVLPEDNEVLQVQLGRGPEYGYLNQAYDNLPNGLRSGATILVHASELGPVYNATVTPTDEEQTSYLDNPKICMYANCESENLRIIGVGFNDTIKVKLNCLACYGTWTELCEVKGVEWNETRT